jgi:hypothetical protein
MKEKPCSERTNFLSAGCPAERIGCTACKKCDAGIYDHLETMIRDGAGYHVFVDVTTGIIYSTPEYTARAKIPNAFIAVKNFWEFSDHSA